MVTRARDDAMAKLATIAASVNLSAEVVLDDDLTPRSAPRAAGAGRRVLLTGATGFLGSHLLAALVEAGDEVTCLVRARDAEDGRRRLAPQAARLRDAGLDREVGVVVGDLGKPRYGLSELDFAELAKTTDVIVHNGALVNLVFPYPMLKASNVRGTVEAIRLSALGGATLHYVSSVGIFFSPSYAGAAIFENEPPRDDGGLRIGYTQTKWVAEQIVRLAQRRGFAATIQRPADISWDSRTGVANPRDFISTLLDACFRLGAAPPFSLRADMVPVDYVARTIVEVSRRPDALGKTLNIGHPAPITWNELVECARAAGVRLDSLDYPTWYERFQALRGSRVHATLSTLLPGPGDDPAAALSDLLSEAKFPRVDMAMLEGCLGELNCPELDAAYVRTRFDRHRRESADEPEARAGWIQPRVE